MGRALREQCLPRQQPLVIPEIPSVRQVSEAPQCKLLVWSLLARTLAFLYYTKRLGPIKRRPLQIQKAMLPKRNIWVGGTRRVITRQQPSRARAPYVGDCSLHK